MPWDLGMPHETSTYIHQGDKLGLISIHISPHHDQTLRYSEGAPDEKGMLDNGLPIDQTPELAEAH